MSLLGLVLFVATCVGSCVAPPPLTTLDAAMMGVEARSSTLTPAAAAAAALATAAALAAAATLRKNEDGMLTPSWIKPRGSSATKHAHSKGGSALTAFSYGSNASSSESEDESDDEADQDVCSGCDDDNEDTRADRRRAPTVRAWSKAQFPAGSDGISNLEMSNLVAAQEWSCPCPDRDNCIGDDRLKLLDLYEHRKKWRARAHSKGGFRDAISIDMRSHYDKSTSQFTRSFVVGPLGDCCAASAGLACGLSIQTFNSLRKIWGIW